MNEAIFFGQDIILENENVILRSLQKEDFEPLNAIAYHPAIWEVGMNNLKEPAHLKEYIQSALTERDNKLSYPFLIFDKQKTG